MKTPFTKVDGGDLCAPPSRLSAPWPRRCRPHFLRLSLELRHQRKAVRASARCRCRRLRREPPRHGSPHHSRALTSSSVSPSACRWCRSGRGRVGRPPGYVRGKPTSVGLALRGTGKSTQTTPRAPHDGGVAVTGSRNATPLNRGHSGAVVPRRGVGGGRRSDVAWWPPHRGGCRLRRCRS